MEAVQLQQYDEWIANHISPLLRSGIAQRASTGGESHE